MATYVAVAVAIEHLARWLTANFASSVAAQPEDQLKAPADKACVRNLYAIMSKKYPDKKGSHTTRTTTDTGSFAELCALAGLSIADLVQLLGVSERTLYRWERGEVAPKKGILELMRDRAARKESPAAGNFTFIDLFAGIGRLRRGFDAIGGKCVFTSEWNKYAQLTYKANYPCSDHEVAGDITQIAAEDIPEHDVLLAGFPCQPFSIDRSCYKAA